MKQSRYAMLNHGPSITAERIEAVEKTLGHQFPDDYRSFLKITNGGQPQRDVFDLPEQPEEGFVSLLYSIDSDFIGTDLVKQNNDPDQQFPANFVAIGDSGFGDLILLFLVDGSIWWRDDRVSWGARDDLDAYIKIADNFDDFFSALLCLDETD